MKKNLKFYECNSVSDLLRYNYISKSYVKENVGHSSFVLDNLYSLITFKNSKQETSEPIWYTTLPTISGSPNSEVDTQTLHF